MSNLTFLCTHFFVLIINYRKASVDEKITFYRILEIIFEIDTPPLTCFHLTESACITRWWWRGRSAPVLFVRSTPVFLLPCTLSVPCMLLPTKHRLSFSPRPSRSVSFYRRADDVPPRPFHLPPVVPLDAPPPRHPLASSSAANINVVSSWCRSASAINCAYDASCRLPRDSFDKQCLCAMVIARKNTVSRWIKLTAQPVCVGGLSGWAVRHK